MRPDELSSSLHMLAQRYLRAALITSISTAFLVLASCKQEQCASESNFYGNCPPGSLPECCPCPFPESCWFETPPIPSWCPDAGGGDAGTDGDADPDGAISLCPSGTCTPPNPQAWEGPAKLFYGTAFDAPPCPEDAPNLVFEGSPEPAPLLCSNECSCEAPPGTCTLPDTWTVSSGACNQTGVNTNFDPPTNWDGSCAANNPIAEGKLCGGVPCVRSVSVSAPKLEEPTCIAHDDGMPKTPKFIGDDVFRPFGRACTGEPWPPCGPSMWCVPQNPDFLTCVHRDGDEPCPEGWPVRHLLYGEVEDKRVCTECTCSERSGGLCSVFAAVYSDDTCGTQAGSTVAVVGEPPQCADLAPGTALAGRFAEGLDYQPGSCMAQGGEVVGEVVLTEPRTFCCLEASTT